MKDNFERLMEAREKIIEKLENGENLTYSDVVLWKMAKREMKKQDKQPLHKKIKTGIKDYAPLISMIRGFFD